MAQHRFSITQIQIRIRHVTLLRLQISPRWQTAEICIPSEIYIIFYRDLFNQLPQSVNQQNLKDSLPTCFQFRVDERNSSSFCICLLHGPVEVMGNSDVAKVLTDQRILLQGKTELHLLLKAEKCRCRARWLCRGTEHHFEFYVEEHFSTYILFTMNLGNSTSFVTYVESFFSHFVNYLTEMIHKIC